MVGEGKREGGWECVCKRDKVGDGRECERVGDGGDKVGSGREGECECVCKRDGVGDGRECESVRESRWW